MVVPDSDRVDMHSAVPAPGMQWCAREMTTAIECSHASAGIHSMVGLDSGLVTNPIADRPA
jgi:hypothetical protein